MASTNAIAKYFDGDGTVNEVLELLQIPKERRHYALVDFRKAKWRFKGYDEFSDPKCALYMNYLNERGSTVYYSFSIKEYDHPNKSITRVDVGTSDRVFIRLMEVLGADDAQRLKRDTVLPLPADNPISKPHVVDDLVVFMVKDPAVWLAEVLVFSASLEDTETTL